MIFLKERWPTPDFMMMSFVLRFRSVVIGNIPSAATIIKCGGILVAENDNDKNGIVSQYYELKL